MALKSDRIHVDSQLDFFMDEVATRGGVVVASTVGSGAAMDQSSQLATYASAPSGKTPLGVLMCDMVNKDLTQQPLNRHKEEVQKGGKVTIWSKGTVVTNMVYPGHTPAAGKPAWLCHSGLVGVSDITGTAGNNGLPSLKVGNWLSSKDEDGYAKLSVNLP